MLPMKPGYPNLSAVGEEHLLSQPVTGAFFDIFVDIFHEKLLDNGLIGPEVEDLSDRLLATPEYAPVMQTLFDQAFDRNRMASRKLFCWPAICSAPILPIPGHR